MINIVFDMDGVLFDTQKIYLKTWFEVAEILKIDNISEAAYLCVGRNRADQHDILKECFGEDFNMEEFYRIKDEIFAQHLSQGGVPLMKGTVEILKYLKSMNANVAIASSSSVASITHHIEETGITEYFQKIVGGNMVRHSKPEPDIYLMACEQIGSNPKDTYAVEDSYNGIRAAYRAGMKTIMIPDVQPPTPETERMTYGCFDSLIDFMNYLKEEEH